MSSGAAMAIALEEAGNMTEGTLVVILPDGGERYLSTPLFTIRDKVELMLFNTMSRKKELFEPLVPGKVSMYSCGLTAHARIVITSYSIHYTKLYEALGYFSAGLMPSSFKSFLNSWICRRVIV